MKVLLRRSKALTLPLIGMVAFLFAAIPNASAATQYVTATPGYVNLGMTTSITVTSPSAGTFTVVVAKPDGSQAS